jgi:hypothetical protein
VDAGHDNVKLLQDLIGIVKLSVRQDIDLGAGPDFDILDFGPCRLDTFNVLNRASIVEPVGGS